MSMEEPAHRNQHTEGSRGSKRGSHKVSRVFAGIGKALVVLLFLTFIVGAMIMWALNMLPGKYLYPGFAILLIIVAVIGFFLWRTPRPHQHRTRYTVLAVLAVLGITVNTMTITTGYNISSFVNQVHQNANATPQTIYDVIALKAHSASLSSLDNSTMGQLATDPNKAAVASHIDLIAKSVTMKDASDPMTLAADLTGGSIGSAVIASSYMDNYQEDDATFYNSVRILTTFSIATPQDAAPAAVSPSTGAFVLYISGIDTSGDISTVSRSDVDQLMVVNPNTHKILLVYTPRDYYVQLPGTTGLKDKLTHSGIYGINMSVKTMESIYGITVNYYLRLNFTSFVNIIDTIGDIDVYSSQSFTADAGFGGYHFNQGYNQLNGPEALAFSRERYAFPDADFQRGIDEQAVIEAIVKKIAQPSGLANYQTILKQVASSVQTNVPTSTLTSLANTTISNGGGWQFTTYSVTGTGAVEPTYSMGPNTPLDVIIPDEQSVQTATKKIKAVLAGD